VMAMTTLYVIDLKRIIYVGSII